MADHFDVFDDVDTDIGRWCHTCHFTRHGDCKPAGCHAERKSQ